MAPNQSDCTIHSESALVMKHVSPAVRAAQDFRAAAAETVLSKTVHNGKLSAALIDERQRIVHGYAWIETTIAALEATAKWIACISERGEMGTKDALVVRILFGEYLSQLLGGIPMSQTEFVRPMELELEEAALRLNADASAAWFLRQGNTEASRKALIGLLCMGAEIVETSGDPTLDEIRGQYRRFVKDRILPHAHQWHLSNALIPDEVVAELAALGTFGVCIKERYGGLGLGKLVMCVITEELSRGWIGAGSLGTRSEIAGELIDIAGTAEQKEHWLPRIASGEVLPTAVFTEPQNGSDLATMQTRARRDADGTWRISGSKTWITHAARSDLMTLLARSVSGVTNHTGLSMFLLPKARGTEADPFPVEGLRGSEIQVLGYRGMREYELSFDDFPAVPAALLGGVEGDGFRQLMQTFEGARIQTAARAVGVAWRAYELGLGYALDRTQFGHRLVEFPRVADKLALMVCEIVAARELTYAAAREKDKRQRCDIDAGMAKLLAARVAWSNADSSVQIHGGNGYALEYEISRVLCDARILNIFEGAAEIQAQIVARGKLACLCN
jgi:(2S)-methylsuccinyl-CoA dehydrogenase